MTSPPAPCPRPAIHQARDCRSTWSGKPLRPSSQSRIWCTRTPARPICRFTPPAAKNKSAAGGAPAARGGGLARQRPAKNGWPSSCRARGHLLAGPPPPDSKAHCVNAPCPTRGPAGATPRPTLALATALGWLVAAGRSLRSTSHRSQGPAAEKSKRQGGSQGRAGKARQNQIRYPARPLDGLHSFQAAPARPWPGSIVSRRKPGPPGPGASPQPPPRTPPPRVLRTATKTPSPAPPALAPQTLHGGPAPDLRPKRPAQTRRASGRRTGTPGCQGSR